MTFSQNWMRFAGVKGKMPNGERQPGKDWGWDRRTSHTRSERIFLYKLDHQKNRVPVPRFCKRLWALQLSELAHLAWADPLLGFGSEWLLKAVIKQWCRVAPAAVLKINSNRIVCCRDYSGNQVICFHLLNCWITLKLLLSFDNFIVELF